MGKAHQTLSLAQKVSNWIDVLLSALLIAAASRIHEESHLIYGPLESSLLDQGFLIHIQLDEFNTPHTGTTLSPLQLWLCRLRRKIPLRQPATSSLGNIFWRHSRFSPQTTRTTRSWATASFLSLTSKHDLCYIIRHSHIQQCLNLTMHISLRHLAAKMPSQLYNNFISLLPSFLPSYETCSITVNPYSTLPLEIIIKPYGIFVLLSL